MSKKAFHVGSEYMAHTEKDGRPLMLVYEGRGVFKRTTPGRPLYFYCDIRKVPGGFECAICDDLEAFFSLKQASFGGFLATAPKE